MTAKLREYFIESLFDVCAFKLEELQAMSDDQIEKAVDDFYDTMNGGSYFNEL